MISYLFRQIYVYEHVLSKDNKINKINIQSVMDFGFIWQKMEIESVGINVIMIKKGK